jgi:hypothetical protein
MEREQETVGNSKGQDKSTEQLDWAQKALRYQDRFNQNSEPKGLNGLGVDTEKVTNC